MSEMITPADPSVRISSGKIKIEINGTVSGDMLSAIIGALKCIQQIGVFVLWQKLQQDQGTCLGRRRIFTFVQASRQRQIPLAENGSRGEEAVPAAGSMADGRS